MISDDLVNEILKHSNEAYAKHHIQFFKCFKGGYGDINDKFCGANSKDVKAVAKKFYKNITLEDIEILLQNAIHEARAAALFMLDLKYDKAADKKQIINLYLNNMRHINNWDLVDISAYKIIGRFCFENNDYSLIYKLSKSQNLWEQRMSVVANWLMVRHDVFKPLLDISEMFLTHKHDIIHKAVRWILREMGKASENGYKELIGFLEKHHKTMPRTMLRYSIERLSKEQKQHYMKKE